MTASFTAVPTASPVFEGGLLIVPTASFGNVGQLAVDLLINTWRLPSVGHILEENLLPCFGGPAYDFDDTPSTELQVFGQGKLYILQQRSPAVLGREEAFAKNLAAWIGEAGFQQVVVLGSIDATLRSGPQLEGSQLRFRAQNEGLQDSCHALGLIELEARGVGETPWEEMLLPPWSVWREVQQLATQSALLVSFAGEGLGNTSEAAVLASLAQALLDKLSHRLAKVDDWKAPISWSHLFGNSLVEHIY